MHFKTLGEYYTSHNDANLAAHRLIAAKPRGQRLTVWIYANGALYYVTTHKCSDNYCAMFSA